MNKPLSLEQLDHVCLIAERLVDCNNAVSENYHTNMLISKASKDYRCTDKLKTQLRWRRWLIGLYDKGAPSTVSVQYHFHEVTREHITISAEFTFSVSGATWKARILQSLSVDDKGCLLFGSNTAIDESDPVNLAYENCDNAAELCRHLVIENLNENFAINGTMGKDMPAIHASDAKSDLERLTTLKNETIKALNAVNISLSVTKG
jgi:hypothetical protein